ncbi:IS66-like element accessory protein TnpA [Rhodospira trueperi]|uniref:Transposase n=1 Tax=Rhodospira trueperi TaxID=69960 RepID=A0A1G7GRH6_9PROT|nr:transposase [Rhodospira trueperi]SDE90755.1 transposase [Rhodospira trueperi]
MRQEILTGVERRRRWSVAQKMAIVDEAAGPPGRVAEVARRHDVSRQQVYHWRRELRRKGLLASGEPGLFLPVTLVDEDGTSRGCGNRDGELGTPIGPAPTIGDAAAVLAPDDPTPTRRATVDPVEIVLRNGRVVRVTSEVPDAVLTRVIRIAEAS